MRALVRTSRWLLPLLLAATGVVASLRGDGVAPMVFAALGGAALGSLLQLLFSGVALLCGHVGVEPDGWGEPDPQLVAEIEREVRRRTAARLVLPLVLLLAQSAAAQRDVDAAHASMFGQPLYMEGMSAGTLTVKVVEGAMDRPRVGQTVLLRAQQGEGAPVRIASAKTDAEGRAHFARLTPQQRYQAIVPLEGGELASAVFAAPAGGGVRLLLSTAEASTSPASAPASAPTSGPSGAASLELVPELTDGAVQVLVLRGEPPQPVKGVAVRFEVRDGDPEEARTDAAGLATFKRAEAAALIATVTFAGVSYATAAITPPESGGLRATFTVYDTTTGREGLRFVAGTHLIARRGEQRVAFRQVIALENAAPQLFDPGRGGLELPLPDGAVGIEIPAAQARLLHHDERRGRIALLNPVPPGKLTLEYTYELPYDGPVLDLRARIAVPAERWTLVILEGAELRGRGPSVAEQRVERMGGTTARVVTLRGARGPTWLDVTIAGLPTPDRRPLYVALGLVGLAGLWALFAGAGARRVREARREVLLDALVAAERGRRAGTLAAAELAAQRSRLLAELRPLWQSTGREAPPGAGAERE